MKKLLLLLATLAVTANAGMFSLIDGKLKSQKTVKPILWEVDAAGFDFRQYTWEDPAGRICTAIFSGGGSSVDCDFKPKDYFLGK